MTPENFWKTIDRPIIGLSPMDGVTDASFRFITAKHGGPDVVFTEFVNVETAFYAPDTLIKDLTYSEIERPVVAQIYGHTPEMFYKVAHIVCELGFDGLDINMGCPAKKVAAKGSGAALILNPELARSIIRSAKQGIDHWLAGQTLNDLNINPDLIDKIRASNRLRTGLEPPPRRFRIPVSVKTRIGYDKVVVDEWIGTLLEEGLSVISVHGRTLKQGYKGDADWGAVARAADLARNSPTLILGNGDLRDMRDVYRRVPETGVDGVLLGRSAQGNPWIFRIKEQVKEALRSSAVVDLRQRPLTLLERFRVILEHSHHFEKHWGPQSFAGMRKHLAWYCHSSPGAAELRSRMVRTNSVGEVVECLRNYAAFIAADFAPTEQAFREHDSRIGSAFTSP
ncbi:MAG: tRNA dihydrouridine synthase [Candidatus Binatia bacterium]